MYLPVLLLPKIRYNFYPTALFFMVSPSKIHLISDSRELLHWEFRISESFLGGVSFVSLFVRPVFGIVRVSGTPSFSDLLETLGTFRLLISDFEVLFQPFPVLYSKFPIWYRSFPRLPVLYFKPTGKFGLPFWFLKIRLVTVVDQVS